jgi:PAS domain S-box-containing protein
MACLLLILAITLILVRREIQSKSTPHNDGHNRGFDLSNELFETFLRNVSIMYWIWEGDSTRVTVNHAWAADFGYISTTLNAEHDDMDKIVHPDDMELFEQHNKALHSGETKFAELEINLKRSNGRWIPVNWCAYAEGGKRLGKPSRVLSVFTEGTAVKGIETYSQLMNATLDAKKKILTHLSQEFRTPLNTMIGLNDLLLLSSLTEDQKEYVRTMQISSEMLLNGVNDLLDLSRFESGHIDLEHRIFNIRHVVESIMDLTVLRSAEKDLELCYQVDPAVPQRIYGDAVRVRQVLLTLVSNAIKFTTEGEVALNVDVEAGPNRGEARIHFSVRDTGIGLGVDELKSIFDPFSKTDSSIILSDSSSGLGLSICRQLARLMNGNLRAESIPGEGSTFHFDMVADVAPNKDVVDESLKENHPALIDKRILVVDDNETIRHIIDKYLGLWGALPLNTGSGFEALQFLERGAPYHAVILDMMMPGMDGIELAKIIRARPAFNDLPLIMLTSAVGHEKKIMEAGIDAVITKPVKPSELNSLLLEVLDKSNLPANSCKRNRKKPIEKRALKILVAEDNPVNQRVCILLLKKLGYDAETAVNGRQVLTRMQKKRYDVVLMDVQMPGMDGLTATSEICKRWPEGLRPYIIGISAHAMNEERGRALAAGMNDYLTKPVSIEELRYALLKVPALEDYQRI